MHLEGLGQMKNPVASLGIESATLHFVTAPQPTTLLRFLI
jgi:hypothetical protein